MRAMTSVRLLLVVAVFCAPWSAGVAASKSQARLRSAGQDTVWPPPGVERGGQLGVTNPRLLYDFKPVYTPEAMRAHIQGTVVVECVVQPDGTVGAARVVKSLDSVYGLDEEALKAVRRWRFVPGMKGSTAVPTLVAVELSFVTDTESAAVAPSSWPAAFSYVGSSARDWTEMAMESENVYVRLTYPKGWSIRKNEAASEWFGVQSAGAGTRVVIVRPPSVAKPAFSPATSKARLEELKDAMQAGLTASGSRARMEGNGQVQPGGRTWQWYEMLVPASDPSIPQAVATDADGARWWRFATNVGSRQVTVDCFVLHRQSATDLEDAADLRTAGPQFATMLQWITIEPR